MRFFSSSCLLHFFALLISFFPNPPPPFSTHLYLLRSASFSLPIFRFFQPCQDFVSRSIVPPHSKYMCSFFFFFFFFFIVVLYRQRPLLKDPLQASAIDNSDSILCLTNLAFLLVLHRFHFHSHIHPAVITLSHCPPRSADMQLLFSRSLI